MLEPDNVASVLDRIKVETHSDTDIQVLCRALQEGHLSLATDERAVAVGGDVNDTVIITGDDFSSDGVFERIRCPKCGWMPSTSSRWSCDHRNTPEPPFASCGTVWHTFSTHGRCPGCMHQWQWTSCLACGEASPHDEWYETAD